MTLRIFGRICFWSIELFMCSISNFDVSLLLDWLIVVDDSLKRRWWDIDDFDAGINDNFFCCDNLRNIDVPLLLRRWPLMILWRGILETVIVSKKTFSIFLVRDVLNSVTLMFQCFFIDDSLMTLWRNIDDTTKIWMQTLKIIEVPVVRIIRTLMFLCCLIDYSLMTLWRDADETLMISMQTVMIIKVFFWLNLRIIDVSLLLRRWFVDDALKNHWWHYEDLDANDKYQWSLYILNHQNVDVLCCLTDYSLMTLWRIFDKIWWSRCKH